MPMSTLAARPATRRDMVPSGCSCPQSDSNSLRTLDTVTAPRNGRVSAEAAKIDILATLKTGAKSIAFDPTQCTLNVQQKLYTPARGFLRHLLKLHRVHAGNPPDASLIEFNRFHVLGRRLTDCAQFTLHRGQLFAKLL